MKRYCRKGPSLIAIYKKKKANKTRRLERRLPRLRAIWLI
jgi:hypothetical protein